MYLKFGKRMIDFILSLCALIVLAPLLMVLTVVGTIKMKGNPFFTQIRPGKDEKLFRMIKFRTMTDERDENGNLLPDEQRLTSYGIFLRSTSLDELPELINILKGDMSIVGPRPQLVRDMVFMTDEQRRRHSVRQGLTGLAQCNGRNAISWEKKLEYDLQYVENVSFREDLKIILKTICCVFKQEGVSSNPTGATEDFGDYLLKNGRITQQCYDNGQTEALSYLNDMDSYKKR